MSLLEDYIGEKLDAATRKRKGLPDKPSLLGALKDPQFREDVKRGFLDSANRGAVASNLGAPVDLVASFLRPLGYNVEKPIGGGEWFGDKMQQMGFVSDQRNPIAEALSSFAIPVGASKLAPKVFQAEQAAIQNAKIAGPLTDGKFATQRGVFGGVNAKTADKAKLAQAEQMLNKGVDPAQVWKETGWGRGPDGKWRFEISDNGARFNTSVGPNGVIENDLTHGMNGLDLGPTVGGILDHPTLKSAYPDGLTTSTIIGNKNTLFGDGVQGSYSDKVLRLNAPAPASAAKSTTLHELQHAVQDAEGFSRGGSPGISDWMSQQMRPQLLKIAREDMAAAKPPTYQQFWGNDVTPEGQAAYDKFLKEWSSKDYQDKLWLAIQQGAPAKAYPRLAGEAEARLVQSRMNLTPEERLSKYPWNADYFKQQTGVGLDDLIHRFDGGEAKSVGFTYPQDAALETARKNGVKMLGLPENNTPMDRARALGFDTDSFHATPYDFNEFRINPYRGSTFLAASGEKARAGAAAGAGDAMGTRIGSDRILPVTVRSGDIKGLSLTDAEKGWLDGIPSILKEWEVNAAMQGKPAGTHWFNWLDEAELPDGTFSYTKKDAASIPYEQAIKTNRDVYGQRHGDYSTASGERWAAENAVKSGKKGFMQNDEAGLSLAITDPSAIRSRFAAFDPARVNENDLLAGAMPFGLLADEDIRSKFGLGR